MSNVILFGAGASYGAGEVAPQNPPLGSQLYKALVHHSPHTWGNLPKDLVIRFEDGSNFELGMRATWDRFGHPGPELPNLLRDIGDYFSQFAPRSPGSTAYAMLAGKIKERQLETQVIFASLNYECLLELETEHVGLCVSYGLGFQLPGQVGVLKPHGSCNFLQDQVFVPAGEFPMGNSGIVDLPIKPTLDLGNVREYIRTQGVPPAICYYMEGKLTQIAPSQIREIQSTLKKELANARNIIVIGVRPNPADTHIWDSIAASQGHLWYVGRSQEEFQSWVSEYRKTGRNRILADTFQTGVDSVVSVLQDDSPVRTST